MKKRIIRLTAWLFAIFLLIVLLFNSAPKVTKQDEAYLSAFLTEWNIKADKEQIHQRQETEIAYISQVQDSVMKSIQHFSVPYDSAGNVHCYFVSRKGLCFDRSLLLEKFCMYAGFEVRHLYVYFNGRGEYPARGDFFDKNLYSHAMFEVKTKQGWMAVGTNCNWLGLDKAGNPMTLDLIREKLNSQSLEMQKQYSIGQPFYNNLPKSGAFRYVYGVYSRHGQFLKSSPAESLLNAVGLKSRFPDYNIRMLLANLW